MLEEPLAIFTDRRKRVERELFLRAMSPVGPPPPEAARLIASTLRDVHVDAGHVLFERGSEPRHAHYVVSGTVLLRGEDGDDFTFGPGSLIGILDLTIGRARTRTATVTADAHLLELSFSRWLEVLEDFPDYTAMARRNLAAGVHEIALSLAPTGGFEHLPNPSAPARDGEVVSRIVMLRKNPCFETATVQAIAEIAARGDVVELGPGATLATPEGGEQRLHLVMSGSVEVERRAAPLIRAVFGPGQFLLASAAFSNAIASYRVAATERSLVFSVDPSEIDDVADDHFDVVRSVMRGLGIDRDALQSVRARRR